MKLKKLLSVVAATAMAASAFAGLAVTASAAGVDDLTVISSDATFIAQDETTETLKKDTLSWGGKLLTLNGDNGYSTAKGYSVLNGVQVQNLLQVKQGRNMAVKVSDACTIDVYHDYNGSRVIQAGSTNKGTDYTVTQVVATNESTSASYDIDTITVPAAGVVYIGASGDVYVAALDVKFSSSTEPRDSYNITVNPSENGSVSAPATAEESSRVTLTVEPDDGYELDTITVTDDNQQNITVSNNGFTMPSANVVVDATFKEKTINYVVGSTEGTLVAASETKVYNFLADALAVSPETEKAAFIASNYYYNDEVYISGFSGLLYYSNKTSVNLDGTTNNGGIRLKADQDAVSIMLAPGATVEVPVNSGGGSDRTAQVRTDNPKDGTVVAETDNIGLTSGTSPQTLTYTNNGTEPQVIHITATGDSFFSQIKVTVPASAGEDTYAEVTAKEFGGVTAIKGAADAPVAAFAAEITPGTVASEGITWSVSAGEATTGEQTKDVTISGDAKIYIGFLVTLDSAEAVAAMDDINADSLTITIN